MDCFYYLHKKKYSLKQPNILMMKNLLTVLLICTLFSCKKDADKTLVNKTWKIESSTVSPAMTIGTKTSSDYLALMGPSSCEATATLSFSENGIFSIAYNGALCDQYTDPDAKPVTWKRDGDKIILSSYADQPLVLNNNKLTATSSFSAAGGSTYTVVRVYKASSK